MDEGRNSRATLIISDLAQRYDYLVKPMRATFTSGGTGFSVALVLPEDSRNHYGRPHIVVFHNDDQFGPRWSGLAGARVPDHKVIPYVNAYAENPGNHPSMLNHTVLGI